MVDLHLAGCIVHVRLCSDTVHWEPELQQSFARYLAQVLPVPGTEVTSSSGTAGAWRIVGIRCAVHAPDGEVYSRYYADGGAILCHRCVDMVRVWWWQKYPVEECQAAIVRHLTGGREKDVPL